MKAYAIDAPGDAGSVREVADPVPAPGQVLVGVRAAGLNPFDVGVIRGRLQGVMEHRFPLVPGMDAAGIVEALGEGVDGLAVGDDVFGSVGKPYLGEGTLAQRAAMSGGTITRTPVSLDHITVAAIPVAGVTALTIADTLAPHQDDVVLVLGATGGVGSFLVQILTVRGASVAAVCGPANISYARELGAVDVIDHSAGDVVESVSTTYPDGVAAIADLRGDREVLGALTERLNGGARVASIVGAVDVDGLKSRGIEGTNVQGRVASTSLDTVVGMLERGEVVSPPIRTFSLDESAHAVEQVATGHVRGKVVVVPDP